MQPGGRLLFGSARKSFHPLLLWQRPDFDAIKPRYTVGLGPERDLACAGKGAVGRGEQLLAVKRDREPLTLRPQANLETGRAHVRTPVTLESRPPASARQT